MNRKQAQIRNWQKSRLTGFCLDRNALTKNEQLLYDTMMKAKQALITNWELEATANIGLAKPLPKYKCWCGKRTNVERLAPSHCEGEMIHVCKNHV